MIKKLSLAIFSLMLVGKLIPVAKADSQILLGSSAVIGGVSLTATKINNAATAYSWGNHSGLYALLSGSYSNPSWLTSLDYSKLTGTPTTKRVETYSGTTNASGVYSVTFSSSFSVAPNIQANVIGGNTEQMTRVSSVSTTGFVINVFQRSTVLSLALSTATTNVNGANVDVMVSEK